MFVLPDAMILRRDAAARLHGRRFHDYQRCATHGAASEMDQMPVVCEAVLARVLAHRRDCNAIAESDAANRERSKKCGHSSSIAALPDRLDIGERDALRKRDSGATRGRTGEGARQCRAGYGRVIALLGTQVQRHHCADGNVLRRDGDGNRAGGADGEIGRQGAARDIVGRVRPVDARHLHLRNAGGQRRIVERAGHKADGDLPPDVERGPTESDDPGRAAVIGVHQSASGDGGRYQMDGAARSVGTVVGIRHACHAARPSTPH